MRPSTLPGSYGSILIEEQWPRVGCWQFTAFPRAVAWLKQWIRDTQREIATLQALWDGIAQPLEERIDYLRQTCYKPVEHRRYLGDKPVQDSIQISEEQYVRTSRGGYTIPARYEREQWYEPVEELDQTHADRRLELANELVNLPPFTAYVRTAMAQHHVALLPPAKTTVDEARVARIRQVSRARFGRPPESPKGPATSATAPEGPPEPPPSLWITRHPTEE